MTCATGTLITPRKPWSRFLNFFWSKICTASTEPSLTVLWDGVRARRPLGVVRRTHTSNESFQYGLSVFLITLRAGVCQVCMRRPAAAYARGGVRLLAVDGDDGKGVGQAEHIALQGAVSRGPGCWRVLRRRQLTLLRPSAATTVMRTLRELCMHVSV